MPIYETKEDLKNEEIAKQYIRSIGYTPVKLKPEQSIDFAVCKGEDIMCLLEFKRRRCNSDKYETLMIHKRKHNAAIRYKKKMNLETILMVQYNDSLRACVFSQVSFTEGYGGRFDRNDPSDFEEVIYIKKEDLKEVEMGK